MLRYAIERDDSLKEIIQHGKEDFPFAYYLDNFEQYDFHCVDWHWHPELEFIWILQGSSLCCAGQEEIEIPQGHGLFINSNVLHRFESPGRTLAPDIVFSPGLLAPLDSRIGKKYIVPILQSPVPCIPLSPNTKWQTRILELLRRIHQIQEKNQGEELLTLRLLLEIWELLFEHMNLAAPPFTDRQPNYRQARLQLMMQYIHDHYRENITLEDIAASASVSKSSALQLFQSDIHTSPVSYLIQYRLSKAAGLLCNTSRSVVSIAEETGFSSAGYFCRRFKAQYHTSPQQYRIEKK